MALTASAFEEDRRAILAAGCNDLVRKPFDIDQLFEIMHRLMGVHFEYLTPHPVQEEPMAVKDLCALPAELRRKLLDAAMILDREAILALVERIRTEYPNEAELIVHFLESYRFEKIEMLARCQD